MSDVIHEYALIEAICSGPLGPVWRAAPVGRSRADVAVSFLGDARDILAVQEALGQRIARAAGLRHPFIALDLGVQPVEGRLALVTEAVDGCTLGTVLGQGA
ncbi:MAG: hypothetical protein VX000_07305, partial [Myxococcota bacterium]|nr:hypothetical protein [Myxococcota bacterium]